jgi:putative endonuclease
MRTPAQRLGDAAETLVAERLSASGWVVHARNVRVRRREIDLIATDPGPPRTLVFVEVRWRASRDFGLAEQTVDHRKRRGLHEAAFTLLADGARRWDLPNLPIRFDLIAVEPGDRLRHYRHGG